MVMWCIPFLGLPVNLIGRILGAVNAKDPETQGFGRAGLAMCIIALFLSIIPTLFDGMSKLHGFVGNDAATSAEGVSRSKCGALCWRAPVGTEA
ncbi:MAG: hypothetical protein NZM42_05460 [Gemmatales bacterium]|nr:hypothetical protein [Gemmatales bacterium]